MKMRVSISVFFLTVLFSPFFSFSQDIHFNLVARSKDDPGGAVISMTQDPQGFLWFSTENGLYKYDGFQYTAYHNEPLNPNSPANDNIWSILADRSGCIWSTPSRSGLDRLDPATGIFTHFRHNSKDPGSLASDTLFCLMQDHEGTLWVGTRSGLDKFDRKTNTFSHYKHNPADPNSISYNKVMILYEDKHNTIWVGTGSTYEDKSSSGGLNQFNKKTGMFLRYLHNEKDTHSLIDNRVRAILEDSRGNFWVGTGGDGLHTLDRKTGKFERHLNDPSHPGKLSRPPIKNIFPFTDDYISFLKEDAMGRIWIGTLGGGTNVYDPATQLCVFYGFDKNSKEKLASNSFITAYRTADNTMWISTSGWANGYQSNLYKIDPYQNKVPHIRIGKTVFCFAVDDEQTLWLGTNKGLLHNNGNGKKEFFLINKDSTSLSNLVFYIEKDGNKLWLATGNGLYLFDRDTKKISGYHHAGSVNGLSSDTVQMIKKDVGNKVWIGGLGGLDLLDTKTGAFTHFRNKIKDPGSISSNAISGINLDKKQNLWVGTDKGLNRFDRQTGAFKKYLNQLTIFSIKEDSGGDTWVGTTAGLFKYDKENDRFLNFTDESGLINKSFAAGWIIEDQQKDIWFNDTNGITRLDKEKRTAVLYGKNQGINGAILFPFGNVRQNGEILWGDTSGYFVLSPNLLKRGNSPPAVAITNFLLNNESVKPSANGVLSAPLMQTKEIHLRHDQNTFSFEFANIDFISANEESRVQYRLQNYDNAWRKVGAEKTAYYFNLPPGNYVFKVKAFNAAGVAAEKDMAIMITPPWWTTWWAWILYALVVVSSAYLFYSNHINQLKIRQADQINVMVATQEGERKRISRDLHDGVGTKLSALKMFLSLLHERAININDDEIKALTVSSEQFVKEVMQDVRGLLLNLSPAVIEEFGYTVAVEGLVNKINETNQLHFTLNIFGMKQQLRTDYELALYRITQELINNILKHAEAKHVSLQIGQRDKQIILMIEDDGKGFDAGGHKDGYGLKNLEARTKLMQGTMTIDSKTGKGTNVLIEIPYNFN